MNEEQQAHIELEESIAHALEAYARKFPQHRIQEVGVIDFGPGEPGAFGTLPPSPRFHIDVVIMKTTVLV